MSQIKFHDGSKATLYEGGPNDAKLRSSPNPELHRALQEIVAKDTPYQAARLKADIHGGITRALRKLDEPIPYTTDGLGLVIQAAQDALTAVVADYWGVDATVEITAVTEPPAKEERQLSFDFKVPVQLDPKGFFSAPTGPANPGPLGPKWAYDTVQRVASERHLSFKEIKVPTHLDPEWIKPPLAAERLNLTLADVYEAVRDIFPANRDFSGVLVEEVDNTVLVSLPSSLKATEREQDEILTVLQHELPAHLKGQVLSMSVEATTATSCPDCQGTGIYEGFSSRGPCQTCQ